jgi:uncharacterized protein YecE (DUF72 family)
MSFRLEKPLENILLRRRDSGDILSFIMAIQCACGSYADPDYAGILYPKKFAPELRLSAYAMWFDHLELNASYYSVPKSNAVAKWLNDTPAAFFFDVRLHRVISQSPEKSAREGRLLNYFLESLQPLIQAKKLGAFLLVLSPNFAPERHRLEELDLLVEKLRPHPLAIELRHRDWIEGEARATTLGWFRKRQVTWVAVDMPRIPGSDIMPAVDEVTNPRLVYLRLHGRNPRWLEGKSAAEKHTYAYNEDELREIAERVRRLADRAENVRVVANNHARDFAPRTALALKELLGLFDETAQRNSCH